MDHLIAIRINYSQQMLSINYFKCQVKYLNMNGKHYMTMALIDMAIQNQVSQKL